MSAPSIYRHIAGRPLALPPLPDNLQNHEAVKQANYALDKVDALHELKQEVNADAMLSPRGKAAKLAKPIADTLRHVATWAGANIRKRDDLNQEESKMLAVPALSQSDAAGAAVDVEIRQWWRGLSVSERAQLMNKFNESPDHQHIEAALLRSPIALADPELLSIRDGWNRQARIENQAQVVAIDRERAALEWSDQAIAHAAGIATSLAEMGRQDMLDAIAAGGSLQADGARAFGFSQEQIDAAKIRAASVDE